MDSSSVKIRWLGHNGFKFSFLDGTQTPPVERMIYIDLQSNNSKLPLDLKDQVPDDADLMLVTHCHLDLATSSPPLVLASKKKEVKVAGNQEVIKHY